VDLGHRRITPAARRAQPPVFAGRESLRGLLDAATDHHGGVVVRVGKKRDPLLLLLRRLVPRGQVREPRDARRELQGPVPRSRSGDPAAGERHRRAPRSGAQRAVLGPGARGGEGDVDLAALELPRASSRQRRWAVVGLGVVAGDADRGVEDVVAGTYAEDPQGKALRRRIFWRGMASFLLVIIPAGRCGCRWVRRRVRLRRPCAWR
jgi:hypothetical protein